MGYLYRGKVGLLSGGLLAGLVLLAACEGEPDSKTAYQSPSSEFATVGVNDWENPGVFQINREPARATFYAYENRQLAQAGKRENSRYFRSLNGDWKFNWVRKPGGSRF